jgi:predicted MFS family arabinose efflux permease
MGLMPSSQSLICTISLASATGVARLSAGSACLRSGFISVAYRRTLPGRRHQHPTLPYALFLYGALGGAFFFLPFLLIKAHGFSATETGAVYLPSLVPAVLSRWSGGLVDRFGARWPMIIGPVVAAVGFALLAILSGEQRYWVYLGPMLVLGFGMAITVVPLTTTVINSVKEGETGTASGINNVVAAVASLLVIAVLGTLVTNSLISTARMVMASAAALALAAAAVTALTIPSKGEAAPPYLGT